MKQFEKYKRSFKMLNDARFNGDFINTPFLLIQEIVNKLNIDWSNPNLKFLDPACGMGSFLLVVKSKLLEYNHTEDYINEHMLYGCDIDERCVNVTRRVVGSKNIVCANSLEREWNMKFDVVIGNPPFNDESSTRKDELSRRQGGRLISKEFINLSLELSKSYVMLISSVSKIWSGASKPRNLEHWTNKGLYAVLNVASKFTSVDKSLNVGCFYFNLNNPNQLINDDFKTPDPPKNNLGCLYRGPKGSSRSSINKLITHDPNGQYTIFETASVLIKTNDLIKFDKIDKDPGFGHYRVVFSKIRTDKIGKVTIASPSDKLSSSAGCIVCTNLDHAKSIKQHLESEYIVNLAISIKDLTSDFNSKYLFERLPNL